MSKVIFNMKRKRVHFFYFLLLMLFPLGVRGQVADYNTGNNWVHPTTQKYEGMNFINSNTGILMNNGTIWYKANFQNNGIVGFDNSLIISPGLSRFEGATTQVISGSGTTRFYDLLFNSQLVASADSLEQNISVADQLDLTNGIITSLQSTPETMMNMATLEAGATCVNVSNSSYVDGFVQKTGNSAFTFPIGNGGYYRPASISAPSVTTDQFAARYRFVNPDAAGYHRTSRTSGVGIISRKEYWVINRTNGASNPQVTLTWNTATTSALLPSDLSKTIIARWNGTQWISEGNVSTTGNATAGTITANVTGYGVFTLASTIHPPVAVNDTAKVVQNSFVNGNVAVNDTAYGTGNIWQITINPLHGTATMNTTGAYTYTPAPSFSGKDSLSYYLLDAYGDTATAKVIVTVTPLSKYLLVNKRASAPVINGDGTTLTWQYTITLTNKQSATIDSIHVTDDLTKVFVAPITYTVTGIMASGNLKANGLYDGSNYTNTLLDVSSLAGNSKDSVVIAVQVDPHGYTDSISNQAVLDATSTITGKISDVLTDDPSNTRATYPRPTITEKGKLNIDLSRENAFSPNGDGKNDTYVIRHSSEVRLSLNVFDRWGSQVYYNDDYQNDWNGTASNGFMGKELPNGTYYYTLTTTNKLTGEVQKFSGFITLRR